MFTGPPTASASAYPNSRSAPPFQLRMRPSSGAKLMMASLAEATMAARCASVASAALRAVMSSTAEMKCRGWPLASRRSETVRFAQTGDPSLRM